MFYISSHPLPPFRFVPRPAAALVPACTINRRVSTGRVCRQNRRCSNCCTHYFFRDYSASSQRKTCGRAGAHGDCARSRATDEQDAINHPLATARMRDSPPRPPFDIGGLRSQLMTACEEMQRTGKALHPPDRGSRATVASHTDIQTIHPANHIKASPPTFLSAASGFLAVSLGRDGACFPLRPPTD